MKFSPNLLDFASCDGFFFPLQKTQTLEDMKDFKRNTSALYQKKSFRSISKNEKFAGKRVEYQGDYFGENECFSYDKYSFSYDTF